MAGQTIQLVVSGNGSMRCVYGELIDLHQLGHLAIRRGSHVEPDEQGRWIADLSPVGGPSLGPFAHRSAALDAELSWLEKNWLNRTDS